MPRLDILLTPPLQTLQQASLIVRMDVVWIPPVVRLFGFDGRVRLESSFGALSSRSALKSEPGISHIIC